MKEEWLDTWREIRLLIAIKFLWYSVRIAPEDTDEGGHIIICLRDCFDGLVNKTLETIKS